MKLPQKIALSVGILIAAGLALYISKNNADSKQRMLREIADEGYETANDVLFPGKSPQDRKLRYGPVLPN